jgi:hypothetical protein
MITDLIYTENSIRTFTGKVFDLKILDPDSICIEDIAHGLANTARFAGQLPVLYSVAQHSFHVAQSALKENQLAALLHDASEAYLGDMPSPFKKLLPDFKDYEDKLMKVIAKKFGFEYPLNSEIKKIDNDYLNMEWNAFVEKIDPTFPLYSPKEAEAQFLAMFQFITK